MNKPIATSPWVALIVPVIKSNSSIQICSDHKQTANNVASCNIYPIPKTEDILAMLMGGENSPNLIFCKLISNQF